MGGLGRGRAICTVVSFLALAEEATGHHLEVFFVIDMNTISTSSLRNYLHQQFLSPSTYESQVKGLMKDLRC